MQVAYAELRDLVGRLTPDQAVAVLQIVRDLVAGRRPASVTEEREATVESGRVRRLSFAGTLHSGRGDLASRSEEIIRDEFGRS